MMSNLKRYRFKTKSVEDPRPLKDMKYINMPWWCTGEAGDGSYATIVCYLPETESLFDYWDDAFAITDSNVTEITYTDRFPKPEWLE